MNCTFTDGFEKLSACIDWTLPAGGGQGLEALNRKRQGPGLLQGCLGATHVILSVLSPIQKEKEAGEVNLTNVFYLS